MNCRRQSLISLLLITTLACKLSTATAQAEYRFLLQDGLGEFHLNIRGGFMFAVVTLLTLSTHGWCQSHELIPGKIIHIVVLLPSDYKRFPFAMQKIWPGLMIAVDNVTAVGGVLHNREIQMHYGETGCSSAPAANEMFEFYMRKQVNVYFGPCCDYAAATVARQMHYWKIPLITAGAFARDYFVGKHSYYDHLTRIGASINSVLTLLLEMMVEFKWKRVKLVYEPEGQRMVGDKFCHVVSDGLHFGLKDQTLIPNLEQDYEKFADTSEILDRLPQEIGDWAERDWSSLLTKCSGKSSSP